MSRLADSGNKLPRHELKVEEIFSIASLISNVDAVKHVFQLLKTKLKPTNKQNKKVAAVKAWKTISKEETWSLVMSMDSQLQVVIESNIFSSKYNKL